MLGNNIRVRLLVLLAAVACCNLLVQSAAACDKNKLARLASGSSLTREGKIPSQILEQKATSAAPMGRPASMVGLWNVVDTNQGQVVDLFFDTWNADGNEFFIDGTNPAADNVCQGTWEQVGAHTYKLKHISWTFDDSGNLNGTAIFHDVVTVSRDGNSYTGTENVYIYDLNGNLIQEYLGDQLQATRIMVDF